MIPIMNNLFNKMEEIELDGVKVSKMKFHIYTLERMNYRTGKHNIPTMKDKIRNIIIKESKKNVGG